MAFWWYIQALKALAAALLRSFATLPGAPMTMELGGITVPSFRKVCPAMMLFSPMTQPSMMVEPTPTSTRSPIEQPCRVQWWVIEQSSPTVVPTPSPKWIITKSWMLLLAPMRIA